MSDYNGETNGNGTHPATRTMTTPREPARRASAPPPKKEGSFVWLWFILGVIVLGCVIAFVLVHRGHEEATVKTNTDKMATPTVLVVRPKPGDIQRQIDLPGTVSALMESSVYAQVSGYIKAWHVDIGAKVTAGQVLAEIDTPVTDQQLKQAGESVKQAQANLDLAKVTAARYNDLLAKHAVSQQDADNQNAQVKVQDANLSAAQAFESGIKKTEDFKQVKAPFDGVITARRIDVGDLVNATGQSASTGSGPQTGTPSQELFRVAQTKTLRVYVNVPEQFADTTKPGVKAKLVLASSPDKPTTGTLVRTAEAIDPNSLTLLCEVDVDNPDGTLLPGGYAKVHFEIQASHPPLIIPGNTLIFRQAGPQVGVVDEDGTVHLKKIVIGRDRGTELEITDGIGPDDQVILNPSDSLADGQKVNIDTDPKKTPKA